MNDGTVSQANLAAAWRTAANRESYSFAYVARGLLRTPRLAPHLRQNLSLCPSLPYRLPTRTPRRQVGQYNITLETEIGISLDNRPPWALRRLGFRCL